MAEEILPKTRELLGNFPQAFSHIGLVNAAWAISQREEALKMGSLEREGLFQRCDDYTVRSGRFVS